MNLVISQPRYLPVISYLQRLAFSHLFVLFDIVKRQYAGWENRNKLLIPSPKWMTIPISSSRMEVIMNTEVRDSSWINEHKRKIIQNYFTHDFFDLTLVDMYYEGTEAMIERGNKKFVDIIERSLLNLAEIFDFTPSIVRASNIENDRVRSTQGPVKLLEIAKAVDADIYVSGENGKVYGVKEAFAGSGIAVRFHAAQSFEYKQPGHDEFIPYMGFFDALFCVGLERVREAILSPPILTE